MLGVGGGESSRQENPVGRRMGVGGLVSLTRGDRGRDAGRGAVGGGG